MAPAPDSATMAPSLFSRGNLKARLAFYNKYEPDIRIDEASKDN